MLRALEKLRRGLGRLVPCPLGANPVGFDTPLGAVWSWTLLSPS